MVKLTLVKPLFVLALCCAALPAWAVPVSIQVLGPDGQPLPGARVSLSERALGEPKALAQGEPVGPQGQLKFEWDGTFPADDAVRQASNKYLWALITAPGMATQTRAISASDTTVRLQAGRVWGGIVRDQNEKPVAGVPLQIKRWSAPAPRNGEVLVALGNSGFYANDLAWTLTATTDAQGRWQIDGLPLSGIAQVRIDDDRFIKSDFDLNLASASAPPLFVKTGATIVGQLLRPDGTPLVGAPVTAGWFNSNETRTDAQGRFTLKGVEPGTVSLYSRERSTIMNDGASAMPEFLVPASPRVEAKAGVITEAGEWKARAGIVVTMRAVDAQTGKPLEGALFRQNNGGTSAKSDAQGAIRARILPVDSPFGPFLGTLANADYVSASLPKLTGTSDVTTIDLGDIKLARGTNVKGTVRVESEGAFFDLTTPEIPDLRLTKGGNNSAYLRFSGSNASFATGPLDPGNYRVELANANSAKEGGWTVVSPQNITVAAPGVAAQPLEIVLRASPIAAPRAREARGQLLDSDGQPVSGAVVTAQLRNGNSWMTSTSVTDENGAWSATASGTFASVDIQSIERPGYIMTGTARTAISGDIATVSGVALKRRGSAFAGRVVNAQGEPAQSWVAILEAPALPPVQSAPDGSFALLDVPLEKFTLIAANDGAYGQSATTSSATDATVQLQPLGAADRAALADAVLRAPGYDYDVARMWNALGAERMETRLSRSSSGRATFATELARRDNAAFLERAPALIEALDAKEKPAIEALYHRARAATEDADARIEANNWVDDSKATKRSIGAESVTQLLQLATVARQLGRDDAADLSDYAAAIATQLGEMKPGNASAWAGPLALGGAPAIARFVEEMKPVAQFQVWSGTLATLSDAGDVAGLRAAIARMKELAKVPEVAASGAKRSWESPDRQLAEARLQLARALAATEGAAALEIANSLDKDMFGKYKTQLLIADFAIAKNDKALAEKALRAAMQSYYSNPEIFALAASLAQNVSPQLAGELWDVAYKKSLPDDDRGGSYQPSVAWWAFYHARLDAGQSRVLIEREWNWRLPAAVKTKDEPYSSDGGVLKELIVAMAPIDAARAMEMREQAHKLTGKPEAPAPSDIQLAAALVAAPAEQARFNVEGEH